MIPSSIKEKISAEAESARNKKQYENGDNPYTGFTDGYTAAAEQILSDPGAWGLAVIVNEKEAIEKVTAAMREADPLFEEVGGSTRHYVRDLLLPILEKSGFAFGKHESTSPTTDRVAVMEEALKAARKALAGCYDVNDYPGDGSSDCDKAIKLIDDTLKQYKQ